MPWRKTSCCLCYSNCGLELLIENNRITKVRPDKDNPRSQGYACRKGMNIHLYQHNAERLTEPLKRVGSAFEPISWDRALDEIAEKLRSIVDQHGPRCLATMGGGGQGGRFQAPFLVSLLRAMGSQYHYSAAAQEWSGMFWVNGRCLGNQGMKFIPDFERIDMLLAVGWNGAVSHSFPRTPKLLKDFGANPDNLFVVVDPRRTKTAKLADVHLPIRPGGDALFFKSLIAIILAEGWQDQEYLDRHVSGFEKIRQYFQDVDIRAALDVCGLDYDQVKDVARQLTRRRSAVHVDLGVFMGRNSTLCSYLEVILLAVAGRMCVRGGSILPGHMSPLLGHTDERNPAVWRTRASGIPAVGGIFPPNVFPEEVMSDNPDRIRALIVSAANPLRSYADTGAYEKAFGQLDLSVAIDLNMTETTRLADYVLPAHSPFESWDAPVFAWNYPDVFFQMRRPVIEPTGQTREPGEIFIDLAERLGLLPRIPESLTRAARGGSGAEFTRALADLFREQPKAKVVAPLIVGRVLGSVLGSAHLAGLKHLCTNNRPDFYDNAVRAGFGPGDDLGDRIYQAIVDHPEGVWIGRSDGDNPMGELATDDGRVNVHIPELIDWLASIEPEAERAALAPDPEFPFVLMAGRHYQYTANSLLRHPGFKKGRRGELALHPVDAAELGLADGDSVGITTGAGSVIGFVETDPNTRPGFAVAPHGFGLQYKGEEIGFNINRLTSAQHRDWLGTPLHRYVPCRLEKIGP